MEFFFHPQKPFYREGCENPPKKFQNISNKKEN